MAKRDVQCGVIQCERFYVHNSKDTVVVCMKLRCERIIEVVKWPLTCEYSQSLLLNTLIFIKNVMKNQFN